MNKGNIVVAVTGASGSIYASRLLQKLSEMPEGPKVSVVFTKNGAAIWEHELPGVERKFPGMAVYGPDDFSAPFASGSALCSAMLVCPCSQGSLARIAQGMADNLVTRTADVMLKERRRLILVTREAPLSLIHIENMLRVTRAGALVCPASPSFYSLPENLEELADTIVDRLLDLAGFPVPTFRWNQGKKPGPALSQ